MNVKCNSSRKENTSLVACSESGYILEITAIGGNEHADMFHPQMCRVRNVI